MASIDPTGSLDLRWCEEVLRPLLGLLQTVAPRRPEDPAVRRVHGTTGPRGTGGGGRLVGEKRVAGLFGGQGRDRPVPRIDGTVAQGQQALADHLHQQAAVAARQVAATDAP